MPGPYVTAAISFAKDPNSETWNCAYNRLIIQGRDTTSIHLTSASTSGNFHGRRSAGRAVAGGFRHRRPSRPSRWAPWPSARSRGRARDHGRLARRTFRADQVRDLRLLVPAQAEMILEGESCRPSARPKDLSGSSPATAWVSDSAKCASHGDHPPPPPPPPPRTAFTGAPWPGPRDRGWPPSGSWRAACGRGGPP